MNLEDSSVLRMITAEYSGVHVSGNACTSDRYRRSVEASKREA